MIPEYLGDLKAVWDLLLKIGRWGYYALRFDHEGPVVSKCGLNLLYSL